MNFLGGLLGYGCYVLLNRYLSAEAWWQAMLSGCTLESEGYACRLGSVA